MVAVLHFADAHINMANYGRQDPETGLPLRVLDFLKSLDTIVDTAINEKVELVVFAGDAYKDRNPAPTFQREWGRRIMRLSNAGIPTILLVGNHDLSPNLSRAHALEEFNTLETEYVIVADQPAFYGPDEIWDLPLQVITVPWVSRSGMVAYLDLDIGKPEEVYEQLEVKLTNLVQQWIEEADPELPILLTAHASVQGASYGGERTVMLGGDLVLSGSLVKDRRLDYVALGHIHKPQNLNEGKLPPVIYPGSIERVDFGEAQEKKFFIIADLKKGATTFEWRELTNIRRFIDRALELESVEAVSEQIRSVLEPLDELKDAIVRLSLSYPRDWETLIDDAALREMTAETFEFHLVKRPQMETRIRLPDDKTIGSMSPEELLELYWKSANLGTEDSKRLARLAQEIITSTRLPDDEV
jgi:exonuclease SbcD